MGIAISLFGVASCVSCLVYSMKRRQNTNTAPQLRANYYNGGAHATTTFASLQVRHQEACAADVQEIQTLIGENGVCHIPSATPNDLDTKVWYLGIVNVKLNGGVLSLQGGITFPNQQANGSIHHLAKTVYIPNGHVHITENPQVSMNIFYSLCTYLCSIQKQPFDKLHQITTCLYFSFDHDCIVLFTCKASTNSHGQKFVEYFKHVESYANSSISAIQYTSLKAK